VNQQPHQADFHAGNDSIGVLHDLAKSLEGQVRKKTVHLYGGTTLTRQVRTRYRGHKIELLANEELILADVEADYGQFELLQINPRSTRFQHGKPARSIRTSGANHVVFTLDGNLSAAQTELYESGVLGTLLDVIDPGEGEEINVSQRLVRVYLQRPNTNRVTTIIDAVIDLMPHDQRAPAGLATFPEGLRPQALYSVAVHGFGQVLLQDSHTRMVVLECQTGSPVYVHCKHGQKACLHEPLIETARAGKEAHYRKCLRQRCPSWAGVF